MKERFIKDIESMQISSILKPCENFNTSRRKMLSTVRMSSKFNNQGFGTLCLSTNHSSIKYQSRYMVSFYLFSSLLFFSASFLSAVTKCMKLKGLSYG